MQLLVQVYSHSEAGPNRVKGIVYLYFFKSGSLGDGEGSLKNISTFFS